MNEEGRKQIVISLDDLVMVLSGKAKISLLPADARIIHIQTGGYMMAAEMVVSSKEYPPVEMGQQYPKERISVIVS